MPEDVQDILASAENQIASGVAMLVHCLGSERARDVALHLVEDNIGFEAAKKRARPT
jgi:hypothetical protein